MKGLTENLKYSLCLSLAIEQIQYAKFKYLLNIKF